MNNLVYTTDFGDVKIGGREYAVLRRGEIAHEMKLQTMAWRLKAERQMVDHLTAIARRKWEMAA